MTLSAVMGSNDKAAVLEAPTYMMTSGGASNEISAHRSQKKYVIVGVSVLLTIGLVIAAILVGMHIFAEQQKAIVQFSLQFKSSNDNQQADQTTVADPNDNSVQFHVTKPGQDVYIVNDFNKDMQIVRIQTSEGTNCYVAPLNRSAAMDPNSIAGPTSQNGQTASQNFILSNTPVSDRSFLTKKAADLCKGVSLYWAYRNCGGKSIDGQQNLTSPATGDRQKRSIYYMNSYYGLPGLGGCCAAYWACRVQMTEYINGYGYHSCVTYTTTGTCCGAVAYPYCNTVYYSYWYTPGLAC